MLDQARVFRNLLGGKGSHQSYKFQGMSSFQEYNKFQTSAMDFKQWV